MQSNMLQFMKLNILSYNIHKGYDWKGQNYFIHEMRELINSSGADLVFLQEVSGQNDQYKTSGFIDVQFEFLADSIWPHYAYAKNAIYDHGHHGNLILSKYPILKWENIDLSTNYFEQRGLLLSQIQIPKLNQILYAGCLHLNLLHSSRKKQYQMIYEKIQSLDLHEKAPLIIGGDFNDWNKRSSDTFENALAMQEVHKEKHGHFAKTFPANIPMLSLDRIYVKNLTVLNSGVVRTSKRYHLSDHLALFGQVEFEKSFYAK